MTADSLRSPFAGLRVADFAWVIAGPMATQFLAMHGADVIHIESRGRLDALRNGLPFIGEPGPDTTAYFPSYNQGKRGVTLNLRDPRAVALARRLIATCDIVTENFAPGTMDRLGLGYHDLRAVRPDLIMLSMGLAGQTGPERHYKGYGTVIQGSAGITHLTGWPDRPPTGTGVAYTDFVASPIGAMAMIAALEHRSRTGEGQHIDLSQQEASLYMLDAALLDYTVNGVVAQRNGNRHPAYAPHGAFPCRAEPPPAPGEPSPGDDVWVALAVTNDAQWRGLKAAMGAPAWADEERFATLLGRKTHEDELEQRIAAWTAELPVAEAVARLRAQGVPASTVASGIDLLRDPQLAHRGHWVDTHHPHLGGFPYDAHAYRINGEIPQPPRPAPLLGGDNAAIFHDLVGLSPEEYATLEAEGALR